MDLAVFSVLQTGDEEHECFVGLVGGLFVNGWFHDESVVCGLFSLWVSREVDGTKLPDITRGNACSGWLDL